MTKPNFQIDTEDAPIRNNLLDRNVEARFNSDYLLKYNCCPIMSTFTQSASHKYGISPCANHLCHSLTME